MDYKFLVVTFELHGFNGQTFVVFGREDQVELYLGAQHSAGLLGQNYVNARVDNEGALFENMAKALYKRESTTVINKLWY
jgi:hypothetical protein